MYLRLLVQANVLRFYVAVDLLIAKLTGFCTQKFSHLSRPARTLGIFEAVLVTDAGSWSLL